MKVKVYFVAVEQPMDMQAIKSRLTDLLEGAEVFNCLRRDEQVAIKIHFGEEGNTGYVHPQYVRLINQAIIKRGVNTFLSDTNILYRGRRMHTQEHLELAREHGFTSAAVGTTVIIPDDTPENTAKVKINQGYIQTAKIAKLFVEADAIVSVAHFKGHLMSGFGGAIKNLGMGCATRAGKLEQHCGVSPFVRKKKCVGCAACAQVCPVEAISIETEKARIDKSKCIGCASCIPACKYNAIDVDWAQGADTIQQKIVEYAYAVLRAKENKRIFFNFALKITKECDCLAKDDPRIAPDVGILAANDPVGIDQASLDLVNKKSGRDVFKKAHPDVDGQEQLEHAAKIGLGSRDYELVEL